VKHRHGTRAAYQRDDCRCLPCRAANARAVAGYKRGDYVNDGYLIPSVGVRRRLQALNAAGWTLTNLSDRLGTHIQATRRLLGDTHDAHETCYIDTHQAVALLYDQLADLQPPEGTPALRARRKAERRGWLPPSAWDDDTIDDPDAIPLEADISKLTRDQRLRLAAQLVEYGMKQKQAAKHCRVDDDAIRKMMKGEAA